LYLHDSRPTSRHSLPVCIGLVILHAPGSWIQHACLPQVRASLLDAIKTGDPVGVALQLQCEMQIITPMGTGDMDSRAGNVLPEVPTRGHIRDGVEGIS